MWWHYILTQSIFYSLLALHFDLQGKASERKMDVEVAWAWFQQLKEAAQWQLGQSECMLLCCVPTRAAAVTVNGSLQDPSLSDFHLKKRDGSNILLCKTSIEVTTSCDPPQNHKEYTSWVGGANFQWTCGYTCVAWWRSVKFGQDGKCSFCSKQWHRGVVPAGWCGCTDFWTMLAPTMPHLGT